MRKRELSPKQIALLKKLQAVHPRILTGGEIITARSLTGERHYIAHARLEGLIFADWYLPKIAVSIKKDKKYWDYSKAVYIAYHITLAGRKALKEVGE